MNLARLLAVLSLVMIGLMSRFLPHPPNFTAISALALFAGVQLRSQKLALLVVFLSLFLSDLVLGLHQLVPVVYGCFALTVFLGARFCQIKAATRTPFVLISSTLLFFTVTNFAYWAMGDLYPKTSEGLTLCFMAALPFLGHQLMGDLFFGASLFGGLWLLEKTFPQIQLSSSLSEG
jgi:hypothetical protein